MDKSEYAAMVDTLARGALRMGDPPRHVAKIAVIDTMVVGDERTFRTSAEPYVDDPSSQTRMWPKDILTNESKKLLPEHPSDLRELAVDLLTIDLYHRMMEIENETIDRAEIEAERRIEERKERHFDRYGHFGPGHDPGPD